MFRPSALIAVLLACLLAAPAGAQVNYDTDPVYQAARANADAGKDAEAFPVFKRVAEDGFAMS